MSAPIVESIASELGVEPSSLRQKYKAERDKRIRPENRDQYLETKDRLDFLTDDPFVEPGFSREPLDQDVDVVIVGGGFGGLLAGVRLRQQGVDNFRIVDSGGDFGGTWYWNRYPGAQCDIESYCYLPMIEELGYMPKERYSYAPEIFDHSRKIAEKFSLYDAACFQTTVKAQQWDEKAGRWIVTTDRGDSLRARFVIMAIGSLNKPKLPGIAGIDAFQGHMFHTCRWDYAYTGGDHTGNLENLADKRVAVIGTGATAIQCVPFLGKDAKHLYVFQRTAASVDVRGNAPTDPEWASSLKPGWQERRRRNFDDTIASRPVEEILVRDGWTKTARLLTDMFANIDPSQLSVEDFTELAEIADFKLNNDVRMRVETTVNDADTAEKLKAWYRLFCKRPTFNDGYLPTFNRANVTLVDTSESKGVERITPTGIVANGEEYEVDCIIFATGFEVSTPYTRRAGIDSVGKDGCALSEYWADGVKSLHGITVHGFPNQLLIAFDIHGGKGVNITAILDDKARHAAYLVKTAIDRDIVALQPTREAEAEWTSICTFDPEASPEALAFQEACTPSYYNNEGQLQDPAIAGEYPHGVNAFNEVLTAWREAGNLEGLELEFKK